MYFLGPSLPNVACPSAGKGLKYFSSFTREILVILSRKPRHYRIWKLF